MNPPAATTTGCGSDASHTRAFIALLPAPTSLSALTGLQRRVLAAAPGRDPRPVRRAALHVTLAFLGRCTEAELAAAAALLPAMAAASAAPRAVTGELLALPSAGRARVLAVALTSDGRIETLAATLRAALAAAQVPYDARPFLAHLSLARVRGGVRPALGPAPGGLALRLPTLGLFASHPAPTGARYTTLARVELGAPPSA